MRLVATEYLTLDGVMEEPGEWSFDFWSDESARFKFDELFASDAQLLGRVTYEGFAKAWPSREGPFADKLNRDPKFVVSTTLRNPQWQHTTVIDGDVPSEIAKLRNETDGAILVAGSATLVRTLLEHDLVDELRLMVFPTVLGRGKRLFPDGIDRLKLRLVESRQVGPDGVQVQVYQRAQ